MRSKRGIGYNDAKLTTKLNLQWAYNWDQRPYGELNPGVDYVPMLCVAPHSQGCVEPQESDRFVLTIGDADGALRTRPPGSRTPTPP